MSKPLEEKNINTISKIESQRNSENYKNIAPKVNYLIDYELMDVFKNILNIPKIDFLSSIMIKVKNYLIFEYNQKTFDEDMFKYLLKHSKERLEKKYDIHLQNLSSTWENFQFLLKNKNKTNEIENNYLKNFYYHCTSTSEYAIHNCDKNEQIFGKFIKVIDKSNNKNLVRYVICENCRKSFFIEHFLNYCEKCELNYYSCEISADKKDLLPATLKTPHCEPVVNEKLHCQFCKNILYINMKTNQVKCANCRFVSSSINMDWKCNICSKPFKSDIIAYNKSEVNYIKKVINYGLLIKKLARPVKLPCCKSIDVKNTSFYHKKDCKGIIYFAEFHKKLIIICEKCKAVNNFGKFIWTCPGCSLRFKDMKWQDNEPRLRKEIFNRKDIQINIDINNGETIDNRINIRNLDMSDLENTIETKTRSKNKSNLYDILRKRTNFMPDINPSTKTEINNIVPQKINKDNKEVSTEGSDSKNNLNINLNIEAFSDSQLSDLIKVKRNLAPLNVNIKKDNNKNLVKKKKHKEVKKKDNDELSSDRKNIKKRYIFEKLIRRQFVSANNIMINNLITEGNQSEKNIQENLKKEEEKKEEEKKEEKDEILENIEKVKNIETIPNNYKQPKFIKRKLANSQSNSELKRVPINNREKRMNKFDKIDVKEISNQNIIKNGKQINYIDLFTEQKSVDKKNKFNIQRNYKTALEEQRSSNIVPKKDNKNGNNNKNPLKEKENINKNQNQLNIENNYPSDQKINVKKYLFKIPNSNNNNNITNNVNVINVNKQQDNKIYNNYKRQDNKNNNINNNNNNNRKVEKEIKINKKIFDKEYKLNNKIYDYNKENKNPKELINHCAINNAGLRKIYKDSYYRNSDKNLVVQTDSKNNSRHNDNKVVSNYNYNNYISINKKNNNNNNNNTNIYNNSNNKNNFVYNNNFNNTFYYSSTNSKMNENAYASTSMKNIKNNSNTNNNEEKSKYDNNTFRNRKEKKNINIIKNEPKKEEEKEEDPPDDIVKVYSIDEMETIPLNPAIIRNPLLYNNIQQRIKHLLFRGKLPLFNVDNYTIKKTLGEGTNGVIYQVMNNKTRKNYAMKKLIASTIAELDFYQKEFQILYENPHPYILNIYGVCARCFDTTTYVLYVLMALAQKDLEMEIADRIKTKKYFKEKELISMLKKLVQALFFLQKERNVAHRDIKPENILIFKNDVLKLADFGEAKINNGSKKKTIRGTEFYMSPLLYAGNLESKYDIQHNPFKSDVFSLGYCFIYASCLDYEIINEIRKISDQSKLRQILKKYFPKIYSARYIDLLLKMIVNDENQRIDFIGLQSILQYF